MPTVIPSAQANRRPVEQGERKLTGLHVLLILVAFFGSVAMVNAVMIHYALSTFRGEVSAKPYEEGLAFNSEIQEARAQAARGWKVDGAVRRDAGGRTQIEVAAHDASGAALSGLHIEAILAAPADKKRDHAIVLEDVGGGVYRGAASAQAGVWDFDLTASRDGKKVFQSRNRITLE
jgi:nitrogen fixation protein FixH